MHPLLLRTQVYASALFMLQSSRTCITGAFKFTQFSSFAPSSSCTRISGAFKFTHSLHSHPQVHAPALLRIRVHALASFFTGTFKSTHRSTRALNSCFHIVQGKLINHTRITHKHAHHSHALNTHACSYSSRTLMHSTHALARSSHACSSLTRASHTCMLITYTRLTHMHAHTHHAHSCTQLMHSQAHPPHSHAPHKHPSPAFTLHLITQLTHTSPFTALEATTHHMTPRTTPRRIQPHSLSTSRKNKHTHSSFSTYT